MIDGYHVFDRVHYSKLQEVIHTVPREKQWVEGSKSCGNARLFP